MGYLKLVEGGCEAICYYGELASLENAFFIGITASTLWHARVQSIEEQTNETA